MSELEIGSYVFTDSNGFRRYRGHGCNQYGSADEAALAARKSMRASARADVFVWRTPEGLFDYTLRPDGNERLPELAGAVLVYRTAVGEPQPQEAER